MQKTSVSLPVSLLQGLRDRANRERSTSRYGYLIERYIREGLERDAKRNGDSQA